MRRHCASRSVHLADCKEETLYTQTQLSGGLGHAVCSTQQDCEACPLMMRGVQACLSMCKAYASTLLQDLHGCAQLTEGRATKRSCWAALGLYVGRMLNQLQAMHRLLHPWILAAAKLRRAPYHPVRPDMQT